MAGGPARQSAMNYRQMAPLIEKAFNRGKPSAVALVINSPGGSPVQSSLIARRIRELADEKQIPVFSFVEDLAASGGYWLAVAGDAIYLDDSSIVGSIGVISSSFGLHKFLEHHGIERRIYTAGKDKSMLDPFQPQKQGDVKRLKEVQSHMHKTFIAHVKERRGVAIGD
ncbi:MAG: S49 family peptidase, partial [Rhodobacteraceae bacterium]|nr:S49 family peptidase [Paracoccaceae bacterium]